MAAHREVTITCDVCYSTFSVVNSRSIRRARSDAFDNGWIFDGKRDFCSREHLDTYIFKLQHQGTD